MEQKIKRPIFLTTMIVGIVNLAYVAIINLISIISLFVESNGVDVGAIGVDFMIFVIICVILLSITGIVLSGLCIPVWNKSEKELNKKKILLFIIFGINAVLAIYNIVSLTSGFAFMMLINMLLHIAVAVFVMLEIYNNFKILKSQTVDSAKEIEEVKDVDAVETVDGKETANEETTEEPKEETVETKEKKVEPKEEN